MSPPRRQLLVVAVTLLPGFAAGADPSSAEPLFTRHVVPVLSKLGCNAGACPGAVQGQNGFRLSLFGADPALDHARLVREYGGRRLNLADPDASLLLLKATGRVPHLGGKQTSPEAPEFAILRNWIAQGAPLDPVSSSQVKSLRVSPVQQMMKAVAALLEDLAERGLLDTTIVTLLGEMGRTPKVETGGGRGHWGTAQSVLVAGGGFKSGTVVGATDKNAAYAVDKKYKVESFGRTIYHLLGIDASQELYTTTNRPMKIILDEAPLIHEALA